jgi:hypothetical protein
MNSVLRFIGAILVFSCGFSPTPAQGSIDIRETNKKLAEFANFAESELHRLIGTKEIQVDFQEFETHLVSAFNEVYKGEGKYYKQALESFRLKAENEALNEKVRKIASDWSSETLGKLRWIVRNIKTVKEFNDGVFAATYMGLKRRFDIRNIPVATVSADINRGGRVIFPGVDPNDKPSEYTFPFVNYAVSIPVKFTATITLHPIDKLAESVNKSLFGDTSVILLNERLASAGGLPLSAFIVHLATLLDLYEDRRPSFSFERREKERVFIENSIALEREKYMGERRSIYMNEVKVFIASLLNALDPNGKNELVEKDLIDQWTNEYDEQLDKFVTELTSFNREAYSESVAYLRDGGSGERKSFAMTTEILESVRLISLGKTKNVKDGKMKLHPGGEFIPLAPVMPYLQDFYKELFE